VIELVLLGGAKQSRLSYVDPQFNPRHIRSLRSSSERTERTKIFLPLLHVNTEE